MVLSVKLPNLKLKTLPKQLNNIYCTPQIQIQQSLGNYDIDFFNFRHRFQIARPKFMKFKRDQNDTVKFQSYIYENQN